MRKSNLTYEELIELAPKDRPFQVEIEFLDKVLRTSWAILSPVLKVDCEQKQINVEYELFVQDYRKRLNSITRYDFNGLLTLIDEYRNMYKKPEVLEVGTEVEILESARDVDYYRTSHFDLLEEITKQIGELNIINRVGDDDYGIYYETKKGYRFPHYCVRPVKKVEKEEEKEVLA